MNSDSRRLINSLPHAYPFVMIDRVVETGEKNRMVCLKNIPFNEEWCTGYMDNGMVFPPVLIIEAMAQTSGLIIGGGRGGMAYLSSIRDARFLQPAVPGDQLIITSILMHELPPLYAFEARVEVRGQIVSEADITLALL